MRVFISIIILLLLASLGAAFWLPGRDGVLGSYSTSLQGRTRGQKMNALRAARAIDGTVIQPGQLFSYNTVVGSWSSDRGYVPAPVSFDGELIVDWGGGVCQTSTTLYNAALIAGLDIVQRNRHAWAPSYVPAGRDAAVAQRTVDLQLRNPYAWPVTLRSRSTAGSIGFQVIGRDQGPMARVWCMPHGTTPPREIIRADRRSGTAARQVITRGRPGISTAVYRRFLKGPAADRRELVSLDTYPAMNRIVTEGE